MTLKLKMIIIGNQKLFQILSLNISLKINFCCETKILIKTIVTNV